MIPRSALRATGRACGQPEPSSAPPSPTGTARWTSWWARVTWWSSTSPPAAHSRAKFSACSLPGMPSPFPGSTSGASAAAASWSAGGGSTSSACCASSGWSNFLTAQLGAIHLGRWPGERVLPPAGVPGAEIRNYVVAAYRRVMPGASMERQATVLIGRCYAGLDAAALREEVLRRLRRMLPVDAAFFATVDPITLLFTSAVADEPLGAATPLFLENEFGREDVNKFSALAESADPVASLDRATRGQRPASARYREIMGPRGLGDELRAALVTKNVCWGALCLHREDASHGFDARAIDMIRRICPHVAEGLRRAVTIGPVTAVGAEAAVPGMIVLDA